MDRVCFRAIILHQDIMVKEYRPEMIAFCLSSWLLPESLCMISVLCVTSMYFQSFPISHYSPTLSILLMKVLSYEERWNNNFLYSLEFRQMRNARFWERLKEQKYGEVRGHGPKTSGLLLGLISIFKFLEFFVSEAVVPPFLAGIDEVLDTKENRCGN